MKTRILFASCLFFIIPFVTKGQDWKMSRFANIGNKFSFAIIADPQLSHEGNKNRVAVNSRLTLMKAIDEINNMNPRPDFIIHLGDLVNVPDSLSFENFVKSTKHACMPTLWIHGNHDSYPPYSIFKHYQSIATGMNEAWYSWEIGEWHFIAIPCNFRSRDNIQISEEKKFVQWLENDLNLHKEKPTIIFGHLPLIPVGLSQLEWYTYFFPLRLTLLDLLTRHGNVKWYFNGHVHNGIKASIKMSKNFKGINFVTCPTIIESRNFGEELSGFEAGLLNGGYYAIVEVDGPDLQLNARLADIEDSYKYPQPFKLFEEKDEPRWFNKIVDFEPVKRIENGGFENGLTGWGVSYRYMSDEDPAFLTEISSCRKSEGKFSVKIHSHSKLPIFWANDDYHQIYQVVEIPVHDLRPIFTANYFLEKKPGNGGGFIRVAGIAGNSLKFHMMFKYGSNESKVVYLPQCILNEYYGRILGGKYLNNMAKEKQAMFWDITNEPGVWHELIVDIADLYDRGIGEEGAFKKLGITKFHISLGTWNNKEEGSESTVYFDCIRLRGSQQKIMSMNGIKPLETGQMIFNMNYGRP